MHFTHNKYKFKIFSTKYYTLKYKNYWNWPFLDVFVFRKDDESQTVRDREKTFRSNLGISILVGDRRVG